MLHLKFSCSASSVFPWPDLHCSSLPCGTAAAYYLPRHLAPNPAYPHTYPYLIRGFPDTAALENRQTLLNDYITSQQMHQWPAAAAMAAQRSDLLRGLTPRDQPLPLPYSAAPRGNSILLTWVFFFVRVCQDIFHRNGSESCVAQVVTPIFLCPPITWHDCSSALVLLLNHTQFLFADMQLR